MLAWLHTDADFTWARVEEGGQAPSFTSTTLHHSVQALGTGRAALRGDPHGMGDLSMVHLGMEGLGFVA